MSDFPKMLYKGDKAEPQNLIVVDEASQGLAEAEGYTDAATFFEQESAPIPRSEAVELREMIAMLETENAELRQKLAAFDRDGDGSPGGSKAKAKAAE